GERMHRPPMADVIAEYVELAAVLRGDGEGASGTRQGRANPADAEGMSDIDAAIGPSCHASGRVQLCRPRGPTVATGSEHTATGHGRDDAVRRDPPNSVVRVISDVQATIGCHRHAKGVDPRLCRGSVVTTERAYAVACHRRDDAVGANTADAIVARIGDIDAT